MNSKTATTDDFQFEVAIPFGTEPYRSPPILPNWLNPWRYRAKRRVQNISESIVYEQWDEWDLNADKTVPGEFIPYVVRGRETEGEYIYEWVCMVDISESGAEARARIEKGLDTVVDEYTIRPFKGERFMAQVGSAQFGSRGPI